MRVSSGTCSRRNCTPTFISSTASSALRPRSGAVDAWDRALGIEGYPDQVDRSGTGFVYYIYGDLAAEWDKVEPVDAAEYHAWLDPYLGEGEELALPYCPLTAENIRMIQTAG